MAQIDPDKQLAFAVEVVRRLRDRGFETYWAGGCVRDQLLGRTPKDYDVATTATPAEIRETFGERRTILVGVAFGVVTVLGPKSAGRIEVATFRQDVSYSDGRHPDAVAFSTPEADAQRRDFTINGLFFDPLEDRVIDFVGGRDDLARGIVRAIGEPRARFNEDKLRLLRAVRFAATFGFLLEPPTREAIEAMAAEVLVVSSERIAAEMRLMLVHPRRSQAVNLLREVGLLATIVPEMAAANRPGELTKTGAPADEAWLNALEALQTLAAPSFPLALSVLVHAFVDSAGGAALCRRWKLSNRETHRTKWLLEHQTALLHARHAAWPKLQRLLVSDGIEELLSLHEAIAKAAGRETADIDHCRELLRLPETEINPAPLLNGDDLIEHGLPQGRHYQRLLEAVRDAQLEKRINTKQEALKLVGELQAEQQRSEPKSD